MNQRECYSAPTPDCRTCQESYCLACNRPKAVCCIPGCGAEVEERQIFPSGWGNPPRKKRVCQKGHVQPETRTGW
jgi:hypothetical protein